MTLQPRSCAGLSCVGVYQWRMRAIARIFADRMCSTAGAYVGARYVGARLMMMVVRLMCIMQLLS
jgi:hypothetical protein